MLALVPWKLVLIVLRFLAALIRFSYCGSALIQGKNAFASYGSVANYVTPGQPAPHSATDN
jgi:hypothetical protein